MIRWFFIAALADCAKVLVLYENPQVRISHSKVITALETGGLELTFKSADDASLDLIRYGVNLYSSVIVLAPSVDIFGGNINARSLVEFLDNEGNIFVAADTNVGDVIREFAAEIGIEIDETGTKVIDHAKYDIDQDGGDHSSILIEPEQIVDAEIITGKVSGPIRFEGIGLQLEKGNDLIFPVMTGSEYSYSWYPEEPITEYPMAIGKELSLIAALQARNNGRVVISGSLKMLSDEFSDLVGQTDFAANIILWACKARGVIRETRVAHHLKGENKSPEFYTINEVVHYEMAIEELKNGEWIPFSGQDVQLDFHRLDPFVRLTMKNIKGVQTAEFTLPDVYGVFQFKVNYDRLGFTKIDNSVQVSVRPLRHNQYERFITTAYPYYFSSFSMMIGVCLLSFVILYHSDSKPKRE